MNTKHLFSEKFGTKLRSAKLYLENLASTSG